MLNVHLLLNLQVTGSSAWGTFSLPQGGFSPSPPQAPLPPHLSLVPEPQTPHPLLASSPAPLPLPSLHTPAESLGSTVKTTGFGISV